MDHLEGYQIGMPLSGPIWEGYHIDMPLFWEDIIEICLCLDQFGKVSYRYGHVWTNLGGYHIDIPLSGPIWEDIFIFPCLSVQCHVHLGGHTVLSMFKTWLYPVRLLDPLGKAL